MGYLSKGYCYQPKILHALSSYMVFALARHVPLALHFPATVTQWVLLCQCLQCLPRAAIRLQWIDPAFLPINQQRTLVTPAASLVKNAAFEAISLSLANVSLSAFVYRDLRWSTASHLQSRVTLSILAWETSASSLDRFCTSQWQITTPLLPHL